jgi:GAF domain-containing protein
MIHKPLDVDRLISAVQDGLTQRDRESLYHRRLRKLRRIARSIEDQRDSAHQRLQRTCTDLTAAYRTLQSQLNAQELVLNFQRELLAAKIDDDVFRSLFRMFVHRSGPVYGISIVCDSSAQLRIVGRFGVPHPDSLAFCQALSAPIIEMMLSGPEATLVDCGDQREMFDPTIQRYLAGLSVLAVPLIPAEGEMIGLVVFYRKGEQPFTDMDVAMADMIAYPTAVAIKRND